MVMEKRSRYIQKIIRFTKEENEYINKKIKASLFKDFQNFARILLITGEVKTVDYSELKKLNEEVNRIGNNINQLTRLAHQFNEISSEDIHDLKQTIEKLKKIVSCKLEEEIKKERKS